MATFKIREAWIIVGSVAAFAVCVFGFSIYRLHKQTAADEIYQENKQQTAVLNPDVFRNFEAESTFLARELGREDTPKEPVQTAPTPTPVPPLPRNTKRQEALHKLQNLGLDATAEGFVKAAKAGTLYVLPTYLELGLGADTTDAAGNPLLLLACEQDRFAVVQQLLEAGANPNAVNAKKADGRSALMVAAERGNQAIMDALINYGAPLDATTPQGKNVLDFAIASRSVPSVQWILERGAVATNPATLTRALETADIEIITAVIQQAQPEQWTRETREALYAALRVRNKPIVEVLLKNHRQPPTLEGYKQPLLAYLIAWGNAPALRLLLESGADPNIPVGSPVEPAYAKLVSEKITRYYLQTEPGVTLLMVASGLGQQDTVSALLKHGAKRGALTGKSKMAAISFAARAGHPEIMQLLLGKSPRPEDQRTRIDISLSSQRAVLWKDNQITAVAPVSTGRAGFNTPSGRYVITDKNLVRHSNIYRVDMPYFMRLSCSEFGIHAGEVPNYPASHGCIRLPREAAVRFFREADVGTLVTIGQ